MADNRTERNVSSGDWKKGSRNRADEAAERGNHRHPRYRGGLPREAIEALERARDALRKEDENAALCSAPLAKTR